MELMENVKIKSKNLNVYYGEKQALFDVNLDLNEKEVTALIGPSGCCLLYTSPSPRDQRGSRMPSSA